MSDAPDRLDDVRPLGPWPALLFLGTVVLLASDIVSDAEDGARLPHLALEIGAACVALTGTWLLALRWRGERRARMAALARAEAEATASRQEAERWRSEARALVEGLGRAIDLQFDRWQLSDAEREVALLLLKGLSLQEVAEVRQTAERTARDQARAIYRKAGLAGRAELSAFFLEDLLLPSR